MGLLNSLFSFAGLPTDFYSHSQYWPLMGMGLFPWGGGAKNTGPDIGDNIANSIMLDSSLSQYLSRAFGAPTDPLKWHIHIDFKIGKVVRPSYTALAGGDSAAYNSWIALANGSYGAGDNLAINIGSGSNQYLFVSNALERDPTGHYSLDVAYDAANATASNRLQAWMNSVPVTWASSPTIVQNFVSDFNVAGAKYFGSNRALANSFFDGYFSRRIFVDGNLPGYTAFGRQSADTAQWVAKTPVGITYGANGDLLEFKDSAQLGKDTSGNNNHWTLNGGIALANQTTDTLTNNFAVKNALSKPAGFVLSKGNLTGVYNATATMPATIGVTSGEWYWEETYEAAPNGDIQFGVAATGFGASSQLGADAYGWGYSPFTGNIYHSGTVTGISGQPVGTVFGFKLDVVAQTLKIYAGTTLIYTFNSVSGSGLLPAVGCSASNSAKSTSNYGQKPFVNITNVGTAKALCTANLPPPAIPDPTKHHYVGTVAKSGNTNFTLPWNASVYDTRFKIKIRNTTGSNVIIDGLRGYDKILFSDTTAAETINANYITVTGTTVTLGSALVDGSYSIVADKAGLTSARKQNLLPYSQDFTTASWLVVGTGTRTISGTAPDSTATACVLGDTSASDAYIVYSSGATIPNDSSAYYFSLYIKSGSALTTQIGAELSGGTAVSNYTTISWSAGIPTLSAGIGSLVNVGSGWYRLTMPQANNSTGNTSTRLVVYPASASVSASGSISVWGAQIEQRSSVGDYYPTTSLPATVSANQLSGFSIVTYTGTGANATVGHGLLKAPEFLSTKHRSVIAPLRDWIVWHSALTGVQFLTYTTGTVGSAATVFNSTVPTSQVLSLGSDASPNTNSATYVAYCHHSVEGYSKFGKFITNGSADGVFTNCGFKPIEVTCKDIDNAGAWLYQDAARNPTNPCIWEYQLNSAGAEYSTVAAGAGERWDFDAAGFKHRTANGGVTTVVYAAYGYPINTATAR
jgi:hypothetical protein